MVGEIKTLEERKNKLLALGKKQGFVTYEQLADELKGLDVDSDSLDELYNALMEAEIDIVTEEGNDDASGEEITCLSIFFHHASGGFPTPGVALWLGIWEEGKQEGKLLEWEIDPDAGVPVEMWGPMFGAERDEVPFVTTGFGKIKSIASVD